MDLDPIEQEFVADVTRWLAGIEAMIAEGNHFVENNAESIASVEALQRAVNSLDSKIITVDVQYIGDNISQVIADANEATGAMERFFTVGEEGIAVENSLADTIRDASNSIYDDAERTRALTDARRDLADAADAVGLSEEEMARLSRASGDAIFQQGEEARTKSDKLRDLMAVYNVLTNEEESTLWIPRDMAEAMGMATAEIEKSGNAAQNAGHQFRILGTGWVVSGYGLHWLIAGTTEFLAVFIPAMIAAGAAAGAMIEGVTWAADRLEATFNTTEATSAMLGKTTGNVFGLKDALQQAQTEADPQIWELLGAAVDACKESFGNFWSQGDEVVQMLDRFAAHVDLALGPGGTLGGQANEAIKSMVSDLQGLGQVLGNVGHIILTFATDMPGVAELILHLAANITGLLNTLLQFKAIGYLLTGFMVIEEIGRWGGLAMLGLGPLITGVGTLVGKAGVAASEMTLFGVSLEGVGEGALAAGAGITEMGTEIGAAGTMTKTFSGALMMPFTTLPGLVLLAGAAVYVLGDRLHLIGIEASQAGQEIKNMQQISSTIGGETPAAAIGGIIQAMQSLNTTAVDTGISGNFFSNIWDTVKGTLLGGTPTVVAATTAMQAQKNEVNQLVQQQTDLFGWNTKIGGSYYGLTEAVGLASAAGVTMNEMFTKQGTLTKTAQQQIENLIAGYSDMAQTGTVLAQDINAIDIQTLMQQTDVSKLNQAWDSFIQNVTGGTGALGSLNASLETIGNVTTSLNETVSSDSLEKGGITLSINQIAQSLKSFSGQSAQTWQNFNESISDAGQMTDWLRTAAAAGGVTNTQYVQSIKGVVAELLPYTASSKTAVAELDAIAQQAGGPTTDSYKTLTTWVGNTKQAQDELNGTVQTATQYMGNLDAVAANLSDTLGSEVDSALAAGIVNTKGITDAAQKFEKQLQKNDEWSGAYESALKGMVKQLLEAGEPVKDVTSVLDSMAKNAGWNTTQIYGMNYQILQLAANLAKIHNVSATVTVRELTTVSGSAATGPIAPGIGKYIPGVASGGRIPGYGGGDTVHAMLEPGEAVVPKHLVSAVAPFLGAHGVPGFAAGGVIPRNLPHWGAPSPMEEVIKEWAREIWKGEKGELGGKSPMTRGAIDKLYGPSTFPSKGIWANPQYKLLMSDIRGSGLEDYYLQDMRYWSVKDRITSLKRTETADIAKYAKYIKENKGASEEASYIAGYQQDIAKDQVKLAKEASPYWRKYYQDEIAKLEDDIISEHGYYKREYEGDISSIRKQYGTKIGDYQEDLGDILRSMGYSKGGLIPFGKYDQGGYLPTGLSMAMNNTGRPEPVGPVGGGPSTIHVHMEVGGKEIADAIIPYMVGSVNRYSYRNSGRATGILKPS
jgi:hypothetical protein